ncbi:MAG: zinc-ribbon domain-containing protein, partial [Thermomicrobiales bacterium]
MNSTNTSGGSVNVCPSCGTLNPDSAKFCQECGTRLTPSQAIDTPPNPIDPAQPPVAESASSSDADSSSGSPESEGSSRPKKDVSG